MISKTSFLEVYDEPIHQEEFKNNYVRIYRAILNPGISTDFHRHSKNTIYIALRGGNIFTEKMKGTPSCPTVLADSLSFSQRISLLFQKIFQKSLNIYNGFVFYMPSKENPVIHKATASRLNNDTMELLGIEFLNSDICKHMTPENPGKIEIETNEILVIRIYVNSDQAFDWKKNNRKGIFIVLSGKLEIIAKEQVISLNTGEYYWTDNQILQKIENQNLEQAEILHILLK